jgi:S1-C subfamily serine protease
VLSGSGFVAAPGLVITNAHVVAGIRHPTVVTRNGTRAATAALFDPNLDIAVLRVSGISAAPLNLVSGSVPRGTKSVVLGYPLGGPFDAEPAVVLARIVAVGRNIYSSRVTTRVVYEVESKVRPGNSGGPLVLPNGSVAGVVFSRSTRNNDIGFTLTSEDAAQKLAAAQRQTSVVSTGACAAE